MSSVVSFKTNIPQHTRYSQFSEAQSCITKYSRGNSGYSQKREGYSNQPNRAQMDDGLQKQFAEQERHRLIMLENKKRARMMQEKLKKDAELKKQHDDELLRRMKEDKKSVYVKYLKENSKNLLQKFKNEKSALASQPDKHKVQKNAHQVHLPSINPKYAQNIDRQDQYHGANMHKEPERIHCPEINRRSDAMEVQENKNIEALDLDINRSTNNFKQIINQYNKDLHRMKQNNDSDPMYHNYHNAQQNFENAEYFYDNYMQQDPAMEGSRLLESLDLNSTATNWNVAKAHKKEGVLKSSEARDHENKMKYNQARGYRGGSRGDEPEEAYEEVEEKIQAIEDDHFNQKSKGLKDGARHRESKKLVKVSDMPKEQAQQDWYLKYIDNQSQCIPSKNSRENEAPRPQGVITSENLRIHNKKQGAQDHDGHLMNRILKEPVHDKKPLMEANHYAEEKNSTRNLWGEELNNMETQFRWAKDLKDDTFYKALDERVPSRQNGARSDQNRRSDQPTVLPSLNVAKPARSQAQSEVNVLQPKKSFPEQNNQNISLQGRLNKELTEPEQNRAVNISHVKKKPSSVVSSSSNRKKDMDEKENISKKHSEPHFIIHTNIKRHNQPVKTEKKSVDKTRKMSVNKGDSTNGSKVLPQSGVAKLNQEEARLQDEIMNLHKQEMGKLRQIQQKYNINTNYENTNQLVNREAAAIPFTDKIINEENIEESLDRLDMLLANQKKGNPIRPPIQPPVQPPNVHQNPYHYPVHPMNPPAALQADNSLYNNVMQGQFVPQNNHPTGIPTQHQPPFTHQPPYADLNPTNPFENIHDVRFNSQNDFPQSQGSYVGNNNPNRYAANQNLANDDPINEEYHQGIEEVSDFQRPTPNFQNVDRSSIQDKHVLNYARHPLHEANEERQGSQRLEGMNGSNRRPLEERANMPDRHQTEMMNLINQVQSVVGDINEIEARRKYSYQSSIGNPLELTDQNEFEKTPNNFKIHTFNEKHGTSSYGSVAAEKKYSNKKKKQQKNYNDAPDEDQDDRNNEKENEGAIKLTTNVNLKHLLFD